MQNRGDYRVGWVPRVHEQFDAQDAESKIGWHVVMPAKEVGLMLSTPAMPPRVYTLR